jgi:acyl-CoA thioesterase-1
VTLHWRPILVALASAAILGLPSCTDAGSGIGEGPPPARASGPPVLYVAVGASETVGIGTDDPIREAWPQILFREFLPRESVFTNLGISGATVQEALARELPEAVALEPDLVTVWLNVNDIIAGVAPDRYEAQLDELLTGLRRGARTRVLVANTPPLDRLPAYLACQPNPPEDGPPCLAGRRLPPPAAIDSIVRAYNRAIERVAGRVGAELVDLHAVGLEARAEGTEPGLVSDDGFHPSPAGHRLVAEAFARVYGQP